MAGALVGEVSASRGMSRRSVHAWMVRYLAAGVPGSGIGSHRPPSSPHRVADVVEVAAVEMRRQHPRWYAKRIRLELLRRPRLEWIPKAWTLRELRYSFVSLLASTGLAIEDISRPVGHATRVIESVYRKCCGRC